MKHLNLIFVFVVLFGCKMNQIEKKEMGDLILNNKDFITERTIYNGKQYILSYSVNEDSTLNFMDSRSEENYHFLASSVSEKPTASIFISIKDSTVYLFDDNIQYKNS